MSQRGHFVTDISHASGITSPFSVDQGRRSISNTTSFMKATIHYVASKERFNRSAARHRAAIDSGSVFMQKKTITPAHSIRRVGLIMASDSAAFGEAKLSQKGFRGEMRHVIYREAGPAQQHCTPTLWSEPLTTTCIHMRSAEPPAVAEATLMAVNLSRSPIVAAFLATGGVQTRGSFTWASCMNDKEPSHITFVTTQFQRFETRSRAITEAHA